MFCLDDETCGRIHLYCNLKVQDKITQQEISSLLLNIKSSHSTLTLLFILGISLFQLLHKFVIFKPESVRAAPFFQKEIQYVRDNARRGVYCQELIDDPDAMIIMQ